MSEPRVVQTTDEQLALWLEGENVHAAAGECCPDFSCCKPEIAAPADERRAFVDHPEARIGMLMTFLGRAIQHHYEGKTAYIAGDQTNYEEAS